MIGQVTYEANLATREDLHRRASEARVVRQSARRRAAGPVAREHQSFQIGIPEGNRIVALDVVNKIEPALFIKMQDGFRVSAGSIVVTALFQAFT